MRDITYQIERWADCWQEMSALWDAYWEEVRSDQEAERLDPNHDVYELLDRNNNLQIITVRDGEKMVGFHIAIIQEHHHHKGMLCGFFDAWYVAPTHRKGLTGYRLLKIVEDNLRVRGVERMYGGNSLKNDVSILLERLGWQETERLYSKSLKG